VTPTNATLQAKVDKPIVVRVTTDEYDELVVGSTDLRFQVDPRALAPQTFQFTVDVPGQVDVELLRQSGCPNMSTGSLVVVTDDLLLEFRVPITRFPRALKSIETGRPRTSNYSPTRWSQESADNHIPHDAKTGRERRPPRSPLAASPLRFGLDNNEHVADEPDGHA
jgi:hypothetical protein